MDPHNDELVGSDRPRREISGQAVLSLVFAVLGLAMTPFIPLWPMMMVFVAVLFGFLGLLEIRADPDLCGKLYAWLAIFAALATGYWQLSMLSASLRYPRRYLCLSNLRVQSSAMFLYSHDYGGHLPPGRSWSDAAKPRHRVGWDWRSCPDLPKGQKGGYAFNSALSGHTNQVPGASSLVLLFESGPGLNICGQREVLLKEPRPEHYDGLNFVFADGHGAWIQQSKTGTLVWTPKPAPHPAVSGTGAAK